MTPPSGRLGAYQAVQTLTADPGRLVLLLLDGAIRFLRQARGALQRGDVGQFAQAQSRAHAIIGALADSLDLEVGGEMAANLAALYDFMLRHLTQGLIARDPAHLERVLGLVQTLREGFEGAVEADGRGGAG
jgi:flagellar protein FliS